MPATPHVEKHFTATETVRDVVIGMADGLTVPFALAAGLAAAVSSTKVIVTAGLAEIVAGAIAMGLGGYLAARTDAEHYGSERAREDWEIDNLRDKEMQEVTDIFRGYGLQGEALTTVVTAVTADRKHWLDFMMRFELGLETPDPKRAPVSAGTIAVVISRRRINSADALYPDVEHFGGIRIFRRIHRPGPHRVRRHQGVFHRHQQGKISGPNAAGRRAGRRRRLRPGACLWLIWLPTPVTPAVAIDAGQSRPIAEVY